MHIYAFHCNEVHLNNSLTKEVDVIVIGSGAAAFSAALTAAIGGLEVLIVEKSEFFGGTTAISGGALWIPESTHAKKAGLPDDRDQVLTYLKSVIGDHLQQDKVDAFLNAGPEALDFLEKHTLAKFIVRDVAPDYQSELKGSVSAGRTLDTSVFDGRLLGKNFDKLRPQLPQFMALGGMMVTLEDAEAAALLGRSWSATAHLFKLVGRYFMDRLKYSRGTRLVYGNALIGSLLKSAIDMDIRLWNQAEATSLIKENGRVSGVSIKLNSKQYDNQNIDVRARGGVVLAAGGAPHNPEWRKSNLRSPETHISMAPASNTGGGITLGIEAGGMLSKEQSEAAFYVPVSVWHKENGEEVKYPHLLGDRLKPGSVAVDSSGLRFTNESSSYHTFVQGMHETSKTDSIGPVFLICDQQFIKKYGLGLARPGPSAHKELLNAGYLIKADSISGLADKLEVPAVSLQKTVAQMNKYADQGHDPDFGKGSTEYNRYQGDKAHSPNPCLGEIKQGPFYAIKLWPGDIGTALGLTTDSAARVLNTDNNPIEGLYACGNDMNSIMSGFYPGGGITIGPGLTFGYLAAKDILAKVK